VALKWHDILLAVLRDTSTNPNLCSRGWIKYFSLKRIYLLVSHFQPYVQVPSKELINSFWSELLSHVEEAWLALRSGFMYPDKERLPRASLLVSRQSCLLQYVIEMPCVHRILRRRSRSRLQLLLLMLCRSD